MSTEQNRALVQRLYDAFNSGDPERLDDVLGGDYVHHDPNLPAEMQRGLGAYKQRFAAFPTAFPGFRLTVEDLVAEGDRVAVRWTFRGTNRGELMGIPATGKEVTFTAISIHRVAGDKIAESWVNFDAMGMMQQLGAVPAPSGAGA